MKPPGCFALLGISLDFFSLNPSSLAQPGKPSSLLGSLADWPPGKPLRSQRRADLADLLLDFPCRPILKNMREEDQRHESSRARVRHDGLVRKVFGKAGNAREFS